MDPLIDLLLLTGFLSAVFCVLGLIAGLCKWAERQFRSRVVPFLAKTVDSSEAVIVGKLVRTGS